MTLKNLLATDGIRTWSDVDAKKLPNESRYAYLVRSYGTVNADRIMREAEVQSWFRGKGFDGNLTKEV